MKKLLILIPLLLLSACAKEPEENLPPIGQNTYQVKIDPASSGLSTTESSENISVNLTSKEDQNVSYQVEFGATCYLNDCHNYPEFLIKLDGYIKSVSTYTVDRLIIDFFGSKGTIFDVYSNSVGTGEPVTYHTSTISPVDPSDGGMVYEYPINANGWMIKRSSGLVDKQKPAFYSITVVFKVS